MLGNIVKKAKQWFWPQTLGRTLYGFVITVIIVPFILFGAFIVHEIDYARQHMLGELQQTVSIQTTSIESWFNEHRDRVRTLSQLPAVVDGDQDNLIRTFDAFARNNNDFTVVTFVDSNGFLFDRSVNIADLDYFKRTQRGENVVSDVLIGRVSQDPVIIFSSPVYNQQGKIKGAVYAAVKLDTIAKMMGKYRFGKTGETILVSDTGFLLTDSRFIPELKRSGLIPEENSRFYIKIDTDEYRTADSSVRSSGRHLDYRGEMVLESYSSIEYPRWFIIGKIDENEVLTPVYNYLISLGILLVLLLSGGLLLAITTVERINKPIIGLAKAAEEMEHGNYENILNDKIAASSPTEIKKLCSAFNSMSQTIRQQFIKLEEAEEKYRIIVENALVGVYIIQNERLVYVNPRLAAIFGYSIEEILNLPSSYDLIHPDDHEIVRGNLRLRLEGAVKSQGYEIRGIRKSGSAINLHVYGSVGKISGQPAIIGIMTDITERKRSEEALCISEKNKSDIINSIPDTLSRFGRDGTVLEVLSTKGNSFMEAKKDALVGLNISDILSPEVAEPLKGRLEAAIETDAIITTEYEININGDTRQREARIVPTGENDALVFVRDITNRVQMERQLEYLSYHDWLTGLYNRAYFEAELQRLQISGEWPVGIIICDVDGLKILNDSLGHKVGDKLLIATANILRDCAGTDAFAARIGGDEFAILTWGSESDPAKIKDCIVALARHYSERPDLMPVHISVGYSLAIEPVSLQQIFREADDQMYAEKNRKRASAYKSLEAYIACVSTGTDDKTG